MRVPAGQLGRTALHVTCACPLGQLLLFTPSAVQEPVKAMQHDAVCACVATGKRLVANRNATERDNRLITWTADIVGSTWAFITNTAAL